MIDEPHPESGEGMRVCPGVQLERPVPVDGEVDAQELYRDWGPVYGVWEGYAADPAIRLAGSSGGASSALALFCLEQRGFRQVLHTAAASNKPYLNQTVVSSSREQLLQRTGSRYAPASPLEGLMHVEEEDASSVLIGKPCDVAGAYKAAKIRPALEEKLGLTIAFFCAGSPSTEGNLKFLHRQGVENPVWTRALRFRGNGWPGRWTAQYQVPGDEAQQTASASYAESWGFLQKYRQWRCYICPDHSGEFADIAVGDPWYRDIEPGEPGSSLIVARTPRGERFIKEAAAAGYIVLEAQRLDLLPLSQPNLQGARGALWGRLLALRVLGAAVPRYSGFSLFRSWLSELTVRQKTLSVIGTAKRVAAKRLWRRVRVSEARAGELPR